MKEALSGIVVFIVLAVMLLQADDELRPEARQLLDMASTSEPSDAYLYLMGIFAAADEEPMAVGARIYASVRQGEQAFLNREAEFSYEDYPADKKLPMPDGDLLCGAWEAGCLGRLFSAKDQYAEMLQTHATVLARYKTFLALEDYRTLSSPAVVSAPLPSYRYITVANRIAIMQAISTAERSGIDRAVGDLLSNTTGLRSHLRQADTLVGKSVFLLAVSENIDVLFVLMRRYGYQLDAELPLLSTAERSFELPMAIELAAIYGVYTNMDGHPEFWNAGDNFPGWATRIFFKPNMSINALYPVYARIAKYSLLPPVAFASAVTEDGPVDIEQSRLRNWVGTVLNQLANSDYEKHVAKVFDVNTKIFLFNELRSLDSLPANLAFIVNPYYDSPNTAFYSENGRGVCLTGPLRDTRNLRCLRVKI
ncbi:hypothetical protein FKG94_06530 [Exilibacterium tricleocarpae]|uniref:Uncharacterized protein n=1 Tax=Exilibacterium tricleocarpae TaxID=2591008 RepID=A0A545TYY1_9GAMM|nr:hypothetical protein [Exilibacterium tricleocarpae]TQV82397.1 hypothetical protein FKG94_06530 [Exilibacterium tricleocarpae]